MRMFLRVGLVVSMGLLSWACGDDSSGSCGPSTCSGCCTSSGKCITSAQVSETNCGKGGTMCTSCSGTDKCTAGACGAGTGPCTSANCPGCCQAGQCMAGNAEGACGTGGAYCQSCGSSQQCTAGRCSSGECNATTNPNGCCYNGVPFPGDNATYCGKGGATCAPCKSNEQCINHTCTVAGNCSTTNCPGCCLNGVCQPGTGVNACGKGGVACQPCGTGQQCLSQTCVASTCGPSCPGCCDKNGACVNGTSEQACGKGGAVCATCTSGQACQSQTCVNVTTTCGPTCPGCCDSSGKCQTGNTTAACGKGGVACQVCGSGQECLAATQKCTCTTTNCKGCCDSTNTCRSGSEATACGIGGAACKACTAPTDKCSAGSCTGLCSFLTCYGCCDSSNNCHYPPNDTNCGYFGLTCSTCTSPMTCDGWGGVCNNTSTCDETNCDGCCMNGKCEPGTQDSACGEAGWGCEVCGGTKVPQLYCGIDPPTGYRECIATPSSTWDVLVNEVDVVEADYDDFVEGSDPPELYVKVSVGTQSQQTSVAAEGYVANFNNAYMFSSTASDLGTKIHFEIYDKDNWSGDDTIIKCDDTVSPRELKLNEKVITSCASDPNNAQFVKIIFKFRAK